MKRLIVIILGLSLPMIAHAEKCVEGEYVISVSPIGALREKAIAEANSVSEKPLLMTEQNTRAILVEEISSAGTVDEVVPYDPDEDLCRRLRKEQRERRRDGELVRRLTCSCNAVFGAAQSVNDQFYYLQWALHQANDIDIDAPEAWGLTKGSRSVVVGVIDSGVAYTHPDLAANMWRNAGEIAGNNIDDDGNGYIDDVRGLNAITYTGNNRLAGDPFDDNGHGTHVAGSIGAVTNNSTGVAGVNWEVQMVAIKFLGANGSGSLMDAIEAVDYATALKRRGVNIILTNNSWGGGGSYQPLLESIRAARDEGILFVAAAGNSSQNIDAAPSYPASYDSENIISVAAVTRDGGLAGFSNYGAVNVDIGAPGDTIASTYLNNGYVYLSGTSMAAPHVSGGLALLKAYSYGLTWQQLKSIVLTTGDDYPALAGKTATGKMMNVHRMLQAAPLNPAPPPGSQQPTPVPTPTRTPTPVPTATPVPQPTATPVPGNWDIGGKVLSGGLPIAGARVELKAGSETLVRMSDANGAFTFPAVRGPVAYSLTITRSGFDFAPVQGYLTGHISHTINAQAKRFTLTVQVLNPQRLPVGGVFVNAGAYGSGQTDTQGRVTFQIPAGTPYQLNVYSSRHRIVEPFLSGELLGDSTRVAIARPSDLS